MQVSPDSSGSRRVVTAVATQPITVFSPAYLKDIGPIPFSARIPLLWVWGGVSSFDVDTSSTQNMLSQYAFHLVCGEHCNHLTYIHVHVVHQYMTGSVDVPYILMICTNYFHNS